MTEEADGEILGSGGSKLVEALEFGVELSNPLLAPFLEDRLRGGRVPLAELLRVLLGTVHPTGLFSMGRFTERAMILLVRQTPDRRLNEPRPGDPAHIRVDGGQGRARQKKWRGKP